ncbi:glycosyltransferase [Methylobacterium sp. 092160098-2]|uniref:glycosyltransferase n=1 Tax=Methylobacterium sp. 092160098-2 TaxID=3025129 RepID=UPI0023819966|nr:glycosyltransferase [Methylobacterium sp. 092160098-2]MDE4915345.1 glycosyltransferase [Methylobacterium sp. 092160098-2]
MVTYIKSFLRIKPLASHSEDAVESTLPLEEHSIEGGLVEASTAAEHDENRDNFQTFFDPAGYLVQNPDVAEAGIDPLTHYLTSGRAEGRPPSPLFDPVGYLAQNSDVAEAGIDPLTHYLTSGRAEGRPPSSLFDPAWYLAQNPDVAEAGIDPLTHYLTNGRAERRAPSPLFDPAWYLAQNPDVAEAGIDPLTHYLTSGRAEGRAPSPLFDPAWYLAQNSDVAEAGIDPLTHYLTSGRAEGRAPSPLFDPVWYLAQNPDVAEAGIDPLTHYLTSGRAEGRAPSQPPTPTLDEQVTHPLETSEAILIPASSRLRKPAVVLITHDCSLSGAPVVVLNMAEYLVANEAFDVKVLSLGGGALSPRFSKLPDFRFLGENTIDSLTESVAGLAGRPLKVAFCNTILTSDLLAPLKRLGFKVVSLVHEMPASIKLFGEHHIRKIDVSADALVFGSSYVKEAIGKDFELQNTSLHIVPTGSAAPSLSDDQVISARRKLREEAGFPENAIVVLGCGTIDHRKGADLFVQVSHRVVQQAGSDLDIRFAWIGNPSLPYMLFCQQDVSKLGLSMHVRFLEPRVNLFDTMPGADLFVLTSREDPFPLVNLSAMASGVPPIVFRHAGGAADALGDGGGIIVPYLDIDSMAETVLTLARNDSQRRAMRENALQCYHQRYTQEAFAIGLSNVLREIGIAIDLSEKAEERNTSSHQAIENGRRNDEVSVVIPSYNHAQYIETAIRSVLEQDYPIGELIIIDDCSKDESDLAIRRVIEHYTGPVKIRYEALKANGGAHAAIMRGLSLARGEILSVLNSDDYYATNRFSTILAEVPSDGDFLAFSAVDFIDGTSRFVDETAGIREWYRMALGHALECPTVGFALLRNNIAVTSGNLVFTKNLYRKIGGFSQYKMCHDWDFILQATHYIEPIFVQSVCMAYRVHETNTLNSTRHLLREEGVPALNRFIDLERHERSPNRLAPSGRNWPIYFEYFIDNYAPWFAPEPLRNFIRHARVPLPATTDTWQFGRDNPAADLGFLTQADEGQDALALRRSLALKSRPIDPSRIRFSSGIDMGS